MNALGQNVRFPGSTTTGETGYYYNYYRDYDPSLGRYIQSDPIGLRGGVNTYGYVYQNPLRYSDPSGESATLAWCFGDHLHVPQALLPVYFAYWAKPIFRHKLIIKIIMMITPGWRGLSNGQTQFIIYQHS